MPLDEFIINVYCEICEAYAAVASTPLRRRGFAPALSYEEVLTMEIVGAYLAMSQDKQIWSYFHRHWRVWFPGLGALDLCAPIGQPVGDQTVPAPPLGQAAGLGATKRNIHLVDGFPVPVCHFRRAHFSQVFRGEATFGYCASKAQTYNGFKAMVVTSDEGIIEDIVLLGAHVDERDALVDMDLSPIQGMLLGDKGFISPTLKEDLASQGIELHTPLRSNMKETRPSGFMRQASRARRLVETVIGQLCSNESANYINNLAAVTRFAGTDSDHGIAKGRCIMLQLTKQEDCQ